MATSKRTSRDQREAVRRFLELSANDQQQVYLKLGQYLRGQGQPANDQLESLLKRQQAAIEALQRARAELLERGELTADRQMTSRRFEQISTELDLGWSASQVSRLFGLWRHALAASLGQLERQGPAERRLRRQVVMRDRKEEEPVAAVKRWLATKPGSESPLDYNAFAKAENAAGKQKRLSTASALSRKAILPWPVLLEVARGKIGLVAARRQRFDQLLAGLGPGDLVAGETMALVSGVNVANLKRLIGGEGFPTCVARLHGVHAFLYEDAVAYADGVEVRLRTEHCLQDQFIETKELAERAQIHITNLRRYINQEDWSRVLKPHGRIGQSYYWKRDEFEVWLKERED